MKNSIKSATNQWYKILLRESAGGVPPTLHRCTASSGGVAGRVVPLSCSEGVGVLPSCPGWVPSRYCQEVLHSFTPLLLDPPLLPLPPLGRVLYTFLVTIPWAGPTSLIEFYSQKIIIFSTFNQCSFKSASTSCMTEYTGRYRGLGWLTFLLTTRFGGPSVQFKS